MTAILNKRVLLAAGVIVAMAAAALGATYAAWNASDDVAGNTVSTAVLGISAAGAAGGSGVTVPLPFGATNVIPGTVTAPEERAVITNNSTIPLDLFMYWDAVTPSGAGNPCLMTKVAWQGAQAGTGVGLTGYPAGVPPTVVGASTDPAGPLGSFALLSVNTGYANKVKIADDAIFGPGASVSMRQVAGFATDADYPANAGTCGWTTWFVGELPV